MIIDNPSLSPNCPTDEQREKHDSACLAIMVALDIGSADGVNHDSDTSWSNTFYGKVPDDDALAAAAEVHGFDLAWGVEVFEDEVWGATFVDVGVRK